MDFTVLADHKVKVKLKESEKKCKHLDSTRELKLWNMNVAVIPLIFGVLGTILTVTGRFGNKKADENHPNYIIV